jgi:hypothetical protein
LPVIVDMLNVPGRHPELKALPVVLANPPMPIGLTALNLGGASRTGSRSLLPDASEVFVEPKRAYKSFHYKAKTTWSSARRGVLSAVGRPNIVVGSPPEFNGEPDIWAPARRLVGRQTVCSF